MKSNGDKCHLLVTTEESVSINIDGSNVKNKKKQKLLAIKFDSSLSFEGSITSLCKKASQKKHALARIVNYMDLPKRKVLIKAFITSQFNYCPSRCYIAGHLYSTTVYPRRGPKTDI